MADRIERSAPLALAAEVRTPLGDDDFVDRSAAVSASFAFSSVNAMLDLEPAALAIRIDIIGDGGYAKPDGVVEHLHERLPEAVKFG